MSSLLRLPLGLSITLNFVLAAVILHSANRPSLPEVTPTASVVAEPAKATPRPAPQWSDLQSEQSQTLLARLAEAGFPPDIVRAIATAQVHAQYAARRKALEADESAVPYWKSVLADPKRQAALRALQREERKAVYDLLGPEEDRGDLFGYRDQALATVPSEKAAQVRDILRDFNERRQDFFANMTGGGTIGPAEMQKLRDFEKMQHVELAKVLTPAELENYDLYTSNTAGSMRYQLAAFQPTEDEFRTIFRLQSAFDEQYRYDSAPTGADQARARMEAQKQLTEQIKLALGVERGAQYEKTTDSNYVQTSRLVARLELPPGTTDQLYAVQKDFEARVRTEVQGLPAAERAAAVTKLQEEAIERVTPLLGGDRGVQAYKRYGGGWLNSPRISGGRASGASMLFLDGR